jgi:hypothetical protein
MNGDNVGMLPTSTLQLDLSTIPTEPFAFGRPDAANVEVVSADPRLEVLTGATGMITMLGVLDDSGPFDAFLAMKVDGNFVTAGFHKGMLKEDFLAELGRCMPPGYEALLQPDASVSEVMVVDIIRTPNRGGSPEIGFTCTDPSQRVRWLGKNKFRIEGRAARSLSVRSELEIDVEGKRIKVAINSGDQPLATASRIRQVLPLGYTALIELPLYPGAEVIVTILRRQS